MTTVGHPCNCPLCGAACGLLAFVEEGRIARLKGDPEDPLSRGYVCPKGVALRELHDDPDRIRAPERRDGGAWTPVAWEPALDDIARRMGAIAREHGPDALAVYLGTPTSHGHSTLFALGPFLLSLGTRNVYTANSADALSRLVASALLYGSAGLLPVPDVERTDYLLMLGANPVISGGSIMTAPGFARHIEALRARGGRLVVLDPRRTETARLADEHVFLRPGTDALALLAIVHTVFAEGLDRPARSGVPLGGIDRLRGLAARFPPERVAVATGVPAATLVRLARELAQADAAVCYGRMGTSTQAFGTTASWLTDALTAVSGNLDRPGGALFTTPAVDMAGLMDRIGLGGDLGRHRSRVRGLPSFNRELPLAGLAEEIETPGRGRIRALVCVGGNPALSAPNGPRLERALGALDLLVCVDPYRNETSRRAHYLLPPSLGLENTEYPLIAYSTAIHNVARLSEAVLQAPPGVRSDWWILWGLTSRILAGRAWLDHGIGSGIGRGIGRALASAGRRLGPDALLGLALGLGPHGLRRWPARALTLGRLRATPHGLDLGPLQPGLAKRLGGREVNLAPDLLVEDLCRLEEKLLGPAGLPRPEPARQGSLLLIGKRALGTMNTWLHNLPSLARGEGRCRLEMHPEDAARRGLEEGQLVRVTSRVGAVEVGLHLTDTVMPGVVCLPFGWGHHREGARLGVASANAGVSINDLTDEGQVDEVSGACDFSGVPVTVSKV